MTGTRKLKSTMLVGGTRNTEFLRHVERTEDAFAVTDDSAVEDVRRILSDVKGQYDQIHMDAQKKEAELVRLKEAIRTEDQKHCAGAEEHSKKEDVRAGLEKQYEDTNRQIAEALTAKKVYNHMLQRVQKE